MEGEIDFTQIKELLNHGKVHEALQVVEKFDQNNLEVKIWRGNLLIQTGDFNQALEQSESALKESNDKKNQFQIFKSTIVHATSLWRLGRIEDSLNLLTDPAFANEFPIAKEEKEDYQTWLGQYYLMLGNIYHDSGDLDASLIAFDQSLGIREKLGHERDLAAVLNNIGNIYIQKGEITRAFESYLRSYEVCVTVNYERGIAFALGNLGILSEMQGNYSLAIDFLERARTIFEETNYEYGLSHSLDYIGKLYFQIGKNGEAKKILTDSLEVKKSFKNDILTAYTLYYLVLVSVDNHEIENAYKYFQNLKDIENRQNNKRVSLFSDMCEALILKYSNRLIDKAEAQKIFKSIIDQGYIEYEITIYATLHLCDLLMLELKQFTDSDVLNELNHLVGKLFEIAKSERLNSLLAEIYLIKSKLALFLGEINQARKYLEEAQSITDENGYLRIAIQISNSFDRLLENSQEIEGLISRHNTLSERIDLAEVEDLFLNIVRKRTTEIGLINETAVGFYILNKENQLVYIKEFTSNSFFDQVKDWIMGIKRSRSENIEKGIYQDRLRYRQYNAIIEFVSGVALCYLFEGQSFSARQKVENIVETLKLDLKIWDALLQPNGETSTDITQLIDQITIELFSEEETIKEEDPKIVQPNNLPDNMVVYKDYIHPVRLWILKVLTSSYRVSRSELAQILSVNSGTLARHLEIFTSNDLVRQEKEFVDDKPRIVYYLEPKGTQLYNEIKQSLLEAFV